MKRIAVAGLLTVLLAGCVAPQPFASPQTFGSPLTITGSTRQYIPALARPEPRLGIGMDRAYTDCADLEAMGATWYYDWSPQPQPCAGVEAIPMLYAPGDGVSNPPPTDAKYLLLLNECDRLDQCNTSPEAAAVAWREWEAQYPAARLVGPNTSRAGLDWLLAWRAAYVRMYGEQPRIWALGIHCYNPAGWCQDWTTAHLALAREWTTSGQVWVTEWATTGCYFSEARPADVDAALDEADDLQAWFDSQPGVGRTAWFVLRLDSAACRTALIGPDGRETVYGAWHRATAQSGLP